MNTLLIIFFAVCIGTMFIFSFIDKKREQSQKKHIPSSILWMIIAFIVGALLIIVYPQSQKANVIGDAERIITLTDIEVYHDTNTNEYFVVDENNWDCFNLIKKTTINTEDGEKISQKVDEMVKIQKELNEFNDTIKKGDWYYERKFILWANGRKH